MVELTNGDILVRYLRQGHNKKYFQLIATNINNTLADPQPFESELNFAAPVIRHYKINPLFKFDV